MKSNREVDLLTLDEASGLVGGRVSVATLRRLYRTGKLPGAVRVGRRIYVNALTFRRWITGAEEAAQ